MPILSFCGFFASCPHAGLMISSHAVKASESFMGLSSCFIETPMAGQNLFVALRPRPVFWDDANRFGPISLDLRLFRVSCEEVFTTECFMS
jgi:hypothetical protein